MREAGSAPAATIFCRMKSDTAIHAFTLCNHPLRCSIFSISANRALFTTEFCHAPAKISCQ